MSRRRQVGATILLGCLAFVLAWWLLRVPTEPAEGRTIPVRAPMKRVASRAMPLPAPDLDAAEIVGDLPEEGPNTRTVSCDLGLPGVSRALAYVVGTEQVAEVTLDAGTFALEVPVEAHRWMIQVEGFDRLVADVPSGASSCVLVQPPIRRDVHVSVRVTTQSGGAPEGDVYVMGCGLYGRSTDGPVEVDISARPCTLTAYHRVGLLSHSTDPIEIDPQPGDRYDVELVLPDGPPAGTGMRLRVVDGGILIDDVVPGAPAERAGLSGGDLILAIDGESTEGMSLEDFVRLGVGEAGSEVHLVVELADGGEGEVVMVREVLEG